MQYVYEAEIWEEEGIWYTRFPQFNGVMCDGETLEEAATGAAEVLALVIATYLDDGRALPKPIFNDPHGLIVSVDVTDEFIAETKCMTVGEAAEFLGISSSRVSQLLSEGKLDVYETGGKRLVTIESINRRLESKPQSGRPKRESQ